MSTFWFPEGLALGFASGSACLSSCGAMLLPWLTGMRRGMGGTLGLLGLFLGGRLGGYLAFGLLAGLAGRAFETKGSAGLLLEGLASLAAALLLALQAWAGLKRRAKGCPVAQAGSLERRFGLAGLVPLGLLTGLSPCGPFAAAGLRAAQAGGPAPAMAFFALFFVGTAVWLLPLGLAGVLRRWEAVAHVARLTLVVLALHYAYVGSVLLAARFHHA